MCIRDRDQGAAGDVKALAMKKWFNTNYHYMAPEIDDTTEIRLAGTKPFDEFAEAKALGTVSYTHLDVYKRQLLFLAVGLWLAKYRRYE